MLDISVNLSFEAISIPSIVFMRHIQSNAGSIIRFVFVNDTIAFVVSRLTYQPTKDMAWIIGIDDA